MTIVSPTTFLATEAAEQHSFGTTQWGTVEVTLWNKTRRVRASRTIYAETYRPGQSDVTAHDMLGRYQQGAKAWPASVAHNCATGQERANFGRDDRSGKFHKANCLFFKD